MWRRYDIASISKQSADVHVVRQAENRGLFLNGKGNPIDFSFQSESQDSQTKSFPCHSLISCLH